MGLRFANDLSQKLSCKAHACRTDLPSRAAYNVRDRPYAFKRMHQS
jgi:hypothetical protein